MSWSDGALKTTLVVDQPGQMIIADNVSVAYGPRHDYLMVAGLQRGS
jgi:hypothetical protein